MDLTHIPDTIAAIGALGTAAFGLVDATKAVPFAGGGVNRIGFSKIKSLVTRLTPGAPGTGLTGKQIVDTLRGNWFNGKDLAGQKAIAKSLIKANLSPTNAAQLAAQTGVDAATLGAIATSITTGTPLTAPQNDVYSRFDFILTAFLDETYQDADQRYTNGTRGWALVFSLILAVVGMGIINKSFPGFLSTDFWTAILVGILATPLAPVAKDLTSALATAVNSLQIVKK